MWLINVASFELHYFVGAQIPSYAILSHTWGKDEITFDQMQSLRSNFHLWTSDHNSELLRSFDKIRQTCHQAKECGLEWAWVDTCCIDKRSSAELSEAINSMFNWYRDALACFVYLEDFDAAGRVDAAVRFPDETPCRWFTRGWTLQELIAPQSITFLDKNWRYFGTNYGLANELARVTTIPIAVIRGTFSVRSYSIAARMSWASDRNTTRIEDIAYCLLGIFDINLPLLYGEGMRAFSRLQDELLRVSDDETLLLGEQSPAAYRRFGGAVPEHDTSVQALQPTSAPRSTSRGLEITRAVQFSRGSIYMRLRCRDGLLGDPYYLGLTPESGQNYRELQGPIVAQRFTTQTFTAYHASRIREHEDDVSQAPSIIRSIIIKKQGRYEEGLRIAFTCGQSAPLDFVDGHASFLAAKELGDRIVVLIDLQYRQEVARWITMGTFARVLVLKTLPAVSPDMLLPCRLLVLTSRSMGSQRLEYTLWFYYSFAAGKGFSVITKGFPTSDELSALLEEAHGTCRKVNINRVGNAYIAFPLTNNESLNLAFILRSHNLRPDSCSIEIGCPAPTNPLVFEEMPAISDLPTIIQAINLHLES